MWFALLTIYIPASWLIGNVRVGLMPQKSNHDNRRIVAWTPATPRGSSAAQSCPIAYIVYVLILVLRPTQRWSGLPTTTLVVSIFADRKVGWGTSKRSVGLATVWVRRSVRHKPSIERTAPSDIRLIADRANKANTSSDYWLSTV